ncbi:LLM class flavin-dependent oxidoreductase [Amycolatopsis sp. NPDC051758]|uniref:LLM class flavin-dependent oxidoreductase n=1 Tax=Amycolatopsis sp. NPDC051758 TaxID=3363935 RepID=UPI0037A101D3
MRIGVGLPAMVPGASGADVLDWATTAEARDFSTLGVLDRIVYPNHEPLTTLAVAAGATRRIRLTTTVLLGATRSPTVLAKQAATLHELSGGRLELGLAAGGRRDDFDVTGTSFTRRGRNLDELVTTLRRTWRDGEIGPTPAAPPPVLVGGHSEAAMRRAAGLADGWISGSGSAEPYADRLTRLHKAWAEAGRTDEPRLVALAYFALGPDGSALARDYLGGCYRGMGRYAERVIGETLLTRDALARTAAEYAGAGCQELVLFPCSADLRQLDLLTDALHGAGLLGAGPS